MTEEQKIAELLKPRYEVMIPYPEMGRHGIKVGDILTDPCNNECARDQDGNASFLFEWETFKEIFKPLQWWERREAGEMPGYMRYEITGQIFRYSDHVREDGMIQIGLYSWGVRSCTPATLSDYNNFLNQQNSK